MSLFGCIPFWTPTRFPEAICPRYGPVYIDDINFSGTLIWYHTYTRTCRHKLTHPHIHNTKRAGSIDWHIHINILLIPTAAISQTAAICITVNDWLAETNFTAGLQYIYFSKITLLQKANICGIKSTRRRTSWDTDYILIEIVQISKTKTHIYMETQN